MTVTSSESEPSLQELANAARVVLFVSNLTDARPVIHRLEALGVPYATHVMGMADPAMRARFQALEEWTEWAALPQIFVDGRFVGGLEEALAHSLLQPPAPEIRTWARWLGYGGLIPFVLPALALLASLGPQDPLARILASYGAVILAFLGAVHWGRVLAGKDDRFDPRLRLVVGVLPALAAWGSLAAGPASALGLQAAAFVVLWAFDWASWRHRPELAWYRQLRTHLTIGAVLSLLLGALASL